MHPTDVKRLDSATAGARLLEACRAHGLPVTKQRREVFSALMPRTDHPTADDIYEAVRVRITGISRATVYRVLETLVRVGVARKVSHPGTAVRFDPIVGRHHHFSCLTCGRLLDLNVPELDRLPIPALKPGMQVTDFSVHYTGTCDQCAKVTCAKVKSTRGPAISSPGSSPGHPKRRPKAAL